MSVDNSPLSLVERIPNIQQNRQPDFVQVRQNKIASIDREINAREKYISLIQESKQGIKQQIQNLKESQEINLQLQAKTDTLIQLHKESRQLMQESRDILQESRDIGQRKVDILANGIKELLALRDRNDTPPVKTPEVAKTDAPIVTSSAKSSKNENVATRPEKLELSPAEKAIEKYQVVSNKPIDHLIAQREVGKVFDYVPHESVKPKDTVTLYQPNSPQIILLAAQSKVDDHVENIGIAHNKDSVKLDKAIQQLMYYSQKNIWESIVKDSLVTKLV
jgi:hypothetical protein